MRNWGNYLKRKEKQWLMKQKDSNSRSSRSTISTRGSCRYSRASCSSWSQLSRWAVKSRLIETEQPWMTCSKSYSRLLTLCRRSTCRKYSHPRTCTLMRNQLVKWPQRTRCAQVKREGRQMKCHFVQDQPHQHEPAQIRHIWKKATIGRTLSWTILDSVKSSRDLRRRVISRQILAKRITT